MLNRRVFPALLLALATTAHADRSVSLTFPNANPREVWVASAAADGRGAAPPAGAKSVVAASTSVNIPGVDPAASLYVLDKQTGNLAVFPVKSIGATVGVKAADFRRVAAVRVQVLSGSNPVAAAQVSLRSGNVARQSFLDPSSRGELRFFDLPAGRMEVTARFKLGGVDQATTQVFDVPVQRAEPEPLLTVLVPAGVETAAPSEPAAAGSSEKPAPKASGIPASGVGGNLLSTLIGFVLFAGLLAAAVYYFRKNPKGLQEKLEQLGAQVPAAGQDPAGTADPAAIPVAPTPPAPAPRIVLDDAAPEPLGVPVAATLTPSPASFGSPALLSEAGDEIPLDEGECIVGREAGLGLSLVGETTVSRRHARLVRQAGTVTVIDEGSTNGTFVNGRRIDQPTPLQSGDRVHFGSVAFRYRG